MSDYSFKTWLESEITFGKYRGQDHTSADYSYLNWMLRDIIDKPHFPKEQQQEIIDYLYSKGKLHKTTLDILATRGQQPKSITQQPQTTQQVQQAQVPQQTSQGKSWFYAKTLQTKPGVFQKDTDIALQQQPNKQWNFINLTTKKTGELTSDEVANKTEPLIEAYRKDDKPLKSPNPSLEDLDAQLGRTRETPQTPDSKPKRPPKKPFSDEQKQIIDRFGEIVKDEEEKGHMMISALAGTGKTTVLVELAWEYGKPGEDWLYIVFNKKNSVEAKTKFPEWVEPVTSNSFLGNLLDNINRGRIPATKRVAKLNVNSKLRLITDGTAFKNLMNSDDPQININLPSSPPCPRCHGELTEDETKYKNKKDKKDLYCSKCKTAPYQEGWSKKGNTLKYLLNDLQYQFKERVVKLTSLAKAHNLHPVREEELEKGLNQLLQEYDIDTTLEEVKEKIEKWGLDDDYTQKMLQHLNRILHYDFMNKDYTEEIKKGTTWLLGDSLPQKTEQEYKNKNLKDYRDFDDDLWFAAMYANKLIWPPYKVVLADEVQDFNVAQQIMLQKLAEQGAKIVAVGDKNQAIYRFRGADAEAFQSLSQKLTEWSPEKYKKVEYQITKNFRSKPNLLKVAEEETGITGLQSGKEWAPDDLGIISGPPNPNATDKSVPRDPPQKYEDVFNNINQERDKGNVIETVFIARTNEPLVHAALKLLAKGVPFIIVGKDIANDLKEHLKKLDRLAKNDSTCDELEQILDSHLTDEKDKYGTYASKTAYLAGLKEITEALTAALNQFMNINTRDSTVAEFKSWLDKQLGENTVELETGEDEQIEKDLAIFNEKMKEKPIVLTTSHRSKGLEFDRVFILRYDQFPHPKTLRKRLPKDLEQENNMKYVALTRGRNELHILDNEGQPGYKPPKQQGH